MFRGRATTDNGLAPRLGPRLAALELGPLAILVGSETVSCTREESLQLADWLRS